jgi:hypothetical protein
LSDPIKLRPGMLVTIGTRIDGGCKYDREDLGHTEDEVGGAIQDVSQWKTVRTIDDLEEFTRASKVRSEARTLIVSACIATPFGFHLCPTEGEPLLDERVAQANALVELFNSGSSHSKVRVVTMRGAIAESRTEALVAVRQELSSLVGQLEQAVGVGNVTTIRELVGRAQQVGKLLDQQSAAKGALGRAVAAARLIAKTIVKRVEQQGEQIADVLEEANLSPISEARFMFAPSSGGDVDEDGLSDVSLERFAALGTPTPPPPPEAPDQAAAAEAG